jgi:hypothetical protein
VRFLGSSKRPALRQGTNKKRKRSKSDIGWQVKVKQLLEALKPGMPVAIYCGTGTSVDSSDIPYWLAHVSERSAGGSRVAGNLLVGHIKKVWPSGRLIHLSTSSGGAGFSQGKKHD